MQLRNSYERVYRLPVPRAAFFSFCLFDPRGTVRFGFAAAFLRAVRFTFFRSAVSVIAFVFATVWETLSLFQL
jgi:hypothetical protein